MTDNDADLCALLCDVNDAPASARIATIREQLTGMREGGELDALPEHTRYQMCGLELALLKLSGDVFALENAERNRAAHRPRPWWQQIRIGIGARR